jgi:hypothetical protein
MLAEALLKHLYNKIFCEATSSAPLSHGTNLQKVGE